MTLRCIVHTMCSHLQARLWRALLWRPLLCRPLLWRPLPWCALLWCLLLWCALLWRPLLRLDLLCLALPTWELLSQKLSGMVQLYKLLTSGAWSCQPGRKLLCRLLYTLLLSGTWSCQALYCGTLLCRLLLLLRLVSPYAPISSWSSWCTPVAGYWRRQRQ